jgi:hypothetical protein
MTSPPGIRHKQPGTCIDCKYGEVSYYRSHIEVGCNLYWYPVTHWMVCDSWECIARNGSSAKEGR